MQQFLATRGGEWNALLRYLAQRVSFVDTKKATPAASQGQQLVSLVEQSPRT